MTSRCIYIYISNLYFQVEKKFNIHGSEGEVLYSAKEKSNCCCRFCCGNIRTLDLSVRDPTGKDVLNFSKNLNCAGLCCAICYPYCTQALHGIYERIIMLKKCGRLDLTVFHFIRVIGTHGN